MSHQSLLWAFATNNKEKIIVSIKSMFDINEIVDISKNKTILHCAVAHDMLDIVKLIIDRNANINAKNKEGKTPLLYALDHRNKEIVKLLISHGANVTDKIKYLNISPLHIAASWGDIEITKLLISNGAIIDINALSKHPWRTPLDCARENGGQEMIQFLNSYGAEYSKIKYKYKIMTNIFIFNLFCGIFKI